MTAIAGEISDKIIFFVDELNKYAPGGSQSSPITKLSVFLEEVYRNETNIDLSW